MRALQWLLCGMLFLSAPARGGGPFDEGIAAYDEGRYAKALSLWLPLAEQGNAAAQFNVATLYEKGLGAAQDFKEAARWYLKAAEQGDAEARRRYANLSRMREVAIDFAGGRFVIAPSQDLCVIALQGTISRDTTLKFDEALARSAALGCSTSWLLLESPGGLTDDGIAVGREVRFRGLRTITRDACASACSLIFLAGTERVLAGSRARIGLHQPARERGLEKSRHCVTSSDSAAAVEIRRFLRWVIPDGADRVMQIILGTSCDSIEWIRGQQALDMGIATRLESADTDIVEQAGGAR